MGTMHAVPHRQPVRATELWSRTCKKRKIQQQQARVTIRLGNREHGTLDPKGGYRAGDVILLKIQNSDGTFDDWFTYVIVTATRRKAFQELTEQDFSNSLETKQELEKFYGGRICDGQEMTMIEFQFASEVDSAVKLVDSGALQIAKLPPGNPDSFGVGAYTVPLIEHDYPAKTPVMWNSAYGQFNIPERNVMLVGDPAHAKAILDVLRADPLYKGGGAGVGFKDEVFSHLDQLDPLAQAIGSVNFILKTVDGRLKGYNTDGLGYALSLEQLFASRNETLAGKSILILGAGGTANAVAFALAQKGAQLAIANRSADKAADLAQRINDYLGRAAAESGGEEIIPAQAKAADVIVNVSTKGAQGKLESYSALAPAPLPASPLAIAENIEESRRILGTVAKSAIISDINLVKGKTPLIALAQELGFETLDGVPMVVAQGVEAFWILYGKLLSDQGISKERVFATMSDAARNS